MILGVDPESRMPAWSLWRDGKIENYGKWLCMREGLYGPSFFTELEDFAKHVDELVIEDQWIDPRLFLKTQKGKAKQFASVKSIKTVHEVRVMITYPFHKAGKPVHVVNTLNWMRSLLMSREGSRLRPRREMKERSKIRATDIVRKEGLIGKKEMIGDDNLADAIVIVDWFIMNRRMTQNTGGGVL